MKTEVMKDEWQKYGMFARINAENTPFSAEDEETGNET